MSHEFVKYQKNGSVAQVTISKPKALNALSTDVLKELDQVLSQIQEDKDLRCMVLTGEGDKAFVAGADIKEIHSLNKDSALLFAEKGQDVFSKIENLRIPVIAAVNGFALGGGLELALSCDFIIASSNAKLGLPECTLGLIPGFGGTVRLARKVGPQWAKQWTFTGDMISAEEALQVGLVNKVCSPGELPEVVQKLASTISKRAPLALTAIKQSINETYGRSVSEAMKIEREKFATLFASQDVKEGTTAFIEKRKPDFKGL